MALEETDDERLPLEVDAGLLHRQLEDISTGLSELVSGGLTTEAEDSMSALKEAINELTHEIRTLPRRIGDAVYESVRASGDERGPS